ncbi:MAG: hypothetical protein DI629_20850 [Mesorhizobium amorphae]|nr:MAG: hypothetical protein DI629_20850 [Mesorhizobium amorphae]
MKITVTHEIDLPDATGEGRRPLDQGERDRILDMVRQASEGATRAAVEDLVLIGSGVTREGWGMETFANKGASFLREVADLKTWEEHAFDAALEETDDKDEAVQIATNYSSDLDYLIAQDETLENLISAARSMTGAEDLSIAELADRHFEAENADLDGPENITP